VAGEPETTPFDAFLSATGFDEGTAERAFLALWDAGFTVVPLDPTKEMLLAARAEHENCMDSDTDSRDGSVYVFVARDAPARIYGAMLDQLYPAEDTTDAD
jgi:hypothetical protein